MILGLDFGNVLKLAGDTRLNAGAAEGVNRLRRLFDRVVVISRVDTPEEGERVKNFILSHFGDLAIPDQDIYLCALRDGKGPIAKRLEITHFIDDRTEVLSYMTSVQYRYAMNPTARQLEDFPPTGMVVVKNWAEVVPLIIASLAGVQ
jgi:hypothetical protein